MDREMRIEVLADAVEATDLEKIKAFEEIIRLRRTQKRSG